MADPASNSPTGSRIGVVSLKLLLLHQNFPGQFRQLAPYLQRDGHELTVICSHDRPVMPGVQVFRYSPPSKPTVQMSLSQQLWFDALARADSVAHHCEQLRQSGWVPDRILAHSGWGEPLGLPEVFPDVPLILWPELWVKPEHGGHGSDPELPPAGLSQRLEQLGRNAITRLALERASAWVLPTIHQAQSLPHEFQGAGLNVIHEGIDTKFAAPNPDVHFEVRGERIDRSTPVLTFVNRNLERLRGFDVFMRSLPSLMREHPQLRVMIVGDDEKGYGTQHPSGRILREVMLEELQGKLDLDRLYFFGRIPHPQLIALLQVSRVHVYLSYPFIMGWSLLEAMSCGCAIVASEGMPVEEVITNGVEGLLVPMDQPECLAHRVSALLRDQNLRESFSKAARQKAAMFDQSYTLPKLAAVVENYSR